ncbi:MAG: hypothetical protein DRN71_05555 [Candidatus Nanohalarchaeota archaeon]|nr:MAG: hypothetical protein DRN71_05555 [Candidatus Nanohaloarchaeota archaeon]
MKENILIILVSLSLVLLIMTNIHLIKTQSSFDATMQTIKGQLDQSKRGIATITQPNYQLTVILSLISLAVGVGTGWILFKNSSNYSKPRK